MPSRFLVVGPAQLVEAVRRAAPELHVSAATTASDRALMLESDCVVVGIERERFAETWPLFAPHFPIVRLLHDASAAGATPAEGDVPCAHAESGAELRLAIRAATVEHRALRLYADLTGSWAHDARGALGVSRLALELFKGSAMPASPTQKMENGLTRLGFLLERLPTQLALALDLPLAQRASPSLFPNLESYVEHLRLVHSQREIALLPGQWAASAASQSLVPFAAGFTEFALSLSSARAKLRLSAEREHELEVECECSLRPPPWDAPQILGAAELSRGQHALPYRLVEAARLALRSDLSLSVELSQRGLVANVRPNSQSS
jgi:hypothetical protein